MTLNEQEINWLNKHKKELPPEEIIPETIKIKKYMDWIYSDGSWPTPKYSDDFYKYEEISEMSKFNELIENPENWEEILTNVKLYNNWVLPNAILLFSKPWFNRVKWKDSIKMGIPFPLFSRSEKKFSLDNGIPIENTSAGKAIIARIISKTSYALKIYLKGKWYVEGENKKNPGGYIVGSIKNDLVQRIGLDLGLKQHSICVCPYCLSFKDKRNRSLLSEHGSGVYGCERCEGRIKNLSKESDKKYFDVISKFVKFIGATIVCPSNDCSGRFIPINFIQMEESELLNVVEKISIHKSTNVFKNPPQEILEKNICCPYCSCNFVIKDALNMKSGYKEKSGMITGLPKTLIWEKIEKTTLDKIGDQDIGNTSFKDRLACPHIDVDSDMIMKQKINLLIDNLLIKMTKLNKNIISGLTSWVFYKASIEWMRLYYKDAYKYFFGWNSSERDMSKLELIKYPGQTKKKVTAVIRGQEVAIHQSFFQVWLKVMEENIEDFTKINENIKDIKDIKWFCQKPKFPNGPVETFMSTVDDKNYIINNVESNSKIKPRMAKIYSIKKVGEDKDYSNEIESYGWQYIKLKKDSCLKKGDNVLVEILVMPGHPTHAPIQRILRLRSQILNSFIIRLKEEEQTGNANNVFWNTWVKQIDKAREIIDLERL
jgi:hypothetical protein